MAASKHLGIRDAVAALYQAATALAGGRIYENRDYPLQQGVESHIQVYRVQSVPERTLLAATAPVDWTTQIRTVIKARKSASASAEAIADDLAVSCYSRVMAAQTLGGLAGLLDPGPFEWDQDEADTSVVQVSWDITVQHRTESNSIA
jgi:hypothetical protein